MGPRFEATLSLIAASFSDASVHTRREEDVPKFWGRSEEFHRNKRPFWVQLRGPHDVRFDFLLRPRILEDELCSCFQTLTKDNHAAGSADGVRGSFDGFVPALQMNQDRDAQEDTLRAPALFRRRLAL